jgi:gluconokinase
MIGLDVGTTGVKAVAFGVGSAWRALALREYPLLQRARREQVQDPVTILEAVGDALAESVSASAGSDVLAISVGAAMHGLIGLDSALEPLTPLITWADARARAEARSLRHSEVDLHALTGVPVHPMSPLAKLAWFAHHERKTLNQARWWVGLKELVLAWLTGRVVTELSSASATGLLDIRRRTWSEEARRIAGISESQLPEILASDARLPLCEQAAARIGLPAGTPVITGAGDGPLGNVGTGAIAPGVAGMSLGTSGAVRMAVPRPAVDSGGSLFCYALTDTLWVLGSAISNGGVVVRWAEQALTPDFASAATDRGRRRAPQPLPADERLLELAAGVPPACEGLVMLPYLLAERGPLWDPDLPGAYLGLRREHTRAHMVRAAVEGVCLQMRLIVDRLDGVHPVHSVRATGGVFRSPLWREVMAAMIGRPFEVVGEAEGTALGAAALGLFALQRAANLTDAVALLVDPRTAAAVPVDARSDLVAAYDRMRTRIPELITELGRVATAVAPVHHLDARS